MTIITASDLGADDPTDEEAHIQAQLLERERARTTVAPTAALRADGGPNANPDTPQNPTMTADTRPIKPGDVALDLAQGRPVHVLEDTGQTALDWSNENGYDLLENYANERFGTTAEDRVFDVVYCSDASSEPTKTYAFPESRLMRVETEKADGGRQVYDRIVVEVLEQLFYVALGDGEAAANVLEQYAGNAGLEGDVVSEARELAEVAQFGGDE